MAGRNNFFSTLEPAEGSGEESFFSEYQTQGELQLVKKTIRHAIEKWLEIPGDDAVRNKKINLLYDMTNSFVDEKTPLVLGTKFSILPLPIQRAWMHPNITIPSLKNKITDANARAVMREAITELLESPTYLDKLFNKPVSPATLLSSPWISIPALPVTPELDEKSPTSPQSSPSKGRKFQ